MKRPNDHVRASAVLTLAIDIGGSHLKAAVLDASGLILDEPARTETPLPASPSAVVAALIGLANRVRRFDRISIGFPGVVRAGYVLSAPNLGTDEWRGFHLAKALSDALGAPARLLNDASVQGLGVIVGHGIELVVTLGTGMGFALFDDGRLAPHLEMSQHPVRKGKSYDEYIGHAALESVGKRHWNRRVQRVISLLKAVVNYDTLYLGGGNAKLVRPALPDDVKIVSNEAGLTGGVRLWDKRMDEIFAARPPAFETMPPIRNRRNAGSDPAE